MESCKGCNSTVGVTMVGFCDECLSSLVKNKGKSEEKGDIEENSGWVLNSSTDTAGKTGIRTLNVDPAIAKALHDHQKEGARFIYRNSFSDLNYFDSNAHESEIK